jgi:hypothetical protein
MQALNRFITIDSTDPDDARRRRLLNIILLGTAIVVAITALLTIITTALGVFKVGGISLFALSLVTLLGFGGIYAVNRYISGRYASIIFLTFVMLVIAFSDTPAEVANGRSLFLFVIPIVISSVLLAPSASFAFYAISAVEVWLLASTANVPPNLPALSSFLLLALLSWLSSRSLEQAVKELRTTNANRDRLVAERTQAVSAPRRDKDRRSSTRSRMA